FTFQEFSQRYAVVDKIEPIELRQQHKNNRQSSSEVFNPLMNVDDVNYPNYFFGKVNHGEISAKEVIEDALEQIQELYKRLLKAGVARECARMVLPMATSTTIYMTGTVRSWIHFIQIRNDEHAQ